MTISIVLYGRNDNYGYNLHKRAALSLNCMAEVLTDTSDEILFVDYNTPDDFPTFPEAIQDTLTKRARNILRILRVRPRIHQRFKSRTRLVALEPIARNVAIRRSSAANRWILSTNTDMIFVPQGTGSLSKLARDLAPGFYHAPRIEIPEVLWESFDRQAPAEIIKTIREWGSTLHLNEIILGSEYILYDGPGDFQLLLRDDLFAHHGFHEGMLLGWHVDSNIARRMYVKYGAIGDLGTHIYGYHCDHTRQVTPAHSHSRVQNDWRIFCDQVDTADVPEQAHTWGCPNDAIEEVRLVSNPANVYVRALRDSLGSPLSEPRRIKYTHETFNKIDYDPAHVLPFLADLFVAMPRTFNVAWFGVRTETLSKFAKVWDRLAFAGKIQVDNELSKPNEFSGQIESGPASQLLAEADVFVFDFGGLPGAPEDTQHNRQIMRKLLHRFVQVVREERRRLAAGLSQRRLVALNAINNQFEWLMRGYVAAAATPCGTYMRHGFVLPAEPKEDWLPLLYVGQAGIRWDDHVINSDSRNLGVITYGPYKYLDAGYYRITLKIELAPQELERGGNEPCLGIDVRVGAEVLAVHLLRRTALRSADHEFHFKVTRSAADGADGIEMRITLFNHIALSIHSVIVEPALTDDEIDLEAPVSPPLAFNIVDWLPYLSTGALGRVDDSGVIARTGPAEFVVFGPYWPLPGGRYEVIFSFETLERENAAPQPKNAIRVDVMSGEEQLAAAVFDFHAALTSKPNLIRLPFEIDATASGLRQIETRVWSSGEARFRLRSVEVKAVPQSIRQDLLPFLLMSERGRRVGSAISSADDRTGIIAYSPIMRIRSGFWRMAFSVEVGSPEEILPGDLCCVIAHLKYGSKLMGVREITSKGSDSKEQHFVFEVPLHSDPKTGLEFVLRIVNPAKVILHALSIEPTEEPVGVEPTGAPHDVQPAEIQVAQSGSIELGVRNWIPFVRTGARAHVDGSSMVVSRGAEEFCVYGPYWTLPAGRYEMRALISPQLQENDDETAVIAQVTAEAAGRLFVQRLWRLNQYRLAEPTTAAEFRLPFSLNGDLSSAARTIETRILAPANAAFRILSLAVVIQQQAPEGDWFQYLTVAECGFHTGTEIKNLQGKAGYVAGTPPIAILPGHYRLWSKVSGAVAARDAVSFEVWCETDVLATETVRSEGDQSLEFDFPHEFSGRSVEVRIRLIEPTAVAIHGLAVTKISDSISPTWRERLGRAKLKDQLTDAPPERANEKDLASLSKFLSETTARVKRKILRR